MNESKKLFLKDKRIGAIDYGKKRLGLAVCDELHISITPLVVFEPGTQDFWTKLIKTIVDERLGAIVVGVPIRHDYANTVMIDEIRIFIDDLKEKSGLPVFEQDEAFTSRRAMDTMIISGKRKKKRAQKGNKDLIAACLILRDFLDEL